MDVDAYHIKELEEVASLVTEVVDTYATNFVIISILVMLVAASDYDQNHFRVGMDRTDFIISAISAEATFQVDAIYQDHRSGKAKPATATFFHRFTIGGVDPLYGSQT